MGKLRLPTETTACEYTSKPELSPRLLMKMTDSACKMKNMILRKNLRNTWHVPCAEIIVSGFIY